MKTQISLFCLLLNVGLVVAQPPHPQWTHTYGAGNNTSEVGNCVQQTSDGGYILVGNAPQPFLIKTDANGHQTWIRFPGGDFNAFVQQTTDGGYIVVGRMPIATFNYDVYLVKTDSLGFTVWTRQYGGNASEHGICVQQTADGGYIIVGTTDSFGAGYDDIYLIKTDALGNQVWQRSYGGDSYDYGEGVQQTPEGGYIIAGITGSFGAGDYDACLIKTNESGDLVWRQAYGGTGWDEGRMADQCSDGGYVVVGKKEMGLDNDDVYLVKTDSLGNQSWSHTYGGSSWDYGKSVQQTLDGGYIISGQTYRPPGTDLYLVKTDPSGVQTWQLTISLADNNIGNFAVQTSDGGYVVTGLAQMLTFPQPHSDAFLLKTEPDGSLLDLPTITRTVNANETKVNLSVVASNSTNSEVNIGYELPSAGQVNVAVYDVMGRSAATVFNGLQPPGTHNFIWNARSKASGIYLIRLEAAGRVEVAKAVVIK